MSRIKAINYMDIANGDGFGTTVFFSGCDAKPKCKGCFNSIAWGFDTGVEYTKELENSIVESLNDPNVSHLSILGGDPLALENRYDAHDLSRDVHIMYGDTKKVWMWTWRRYEDIEKYMPFVLNYVDILVDGRFELSKKVPNLPYRGSTNQRVIDVQKSRKEEKIILYK